MKLRVLDLFSGVGGFSLGLHRTGGFETVSFCELKPHARAVLAKNFPGVPSHDDVTTYDFKEGEADVITAGFPCQDISYAGLGAGLAGARSGLYREVIRALRLVRPVNAVLENVAALLGRGLDTVLGDMAAIGYDAEWHCIPASAVGAPHRRDRIWIIAHARGEQHEGSRAPLSGTLAQELSRAFARNTGASLGDDHQADPQHSDTNGFGSHRAAIDLHRSVEFRDEQIGQSGQVGEGVADATGERRSEAGRVRHNEPTEWIASSCESLGDADSKGLSVAGDAGGQGEASPGIEAWRAVDRAGWWATEPGLGRVAHGVPQKLDGSTHAEEEHDAKTGPQGDRERNGVPGVRSDGRLATPPSGLFATNVGRGSLPDLPCEGGPKGRNTPHESDEGLRALRQGISANAQQEAQTLQPGMSFGCWPHERGKTVGIWAEEPDVARVSSGVPNRVDRLEELGNAVVPAIPEIIGRAILQSMNITPEALAS